MDSRLWPEALGFLGLPCRRTGEDQLPPETGSDLEIAASVRALGGGGDGKVSLNSCLPRALEFDFVWKWCLVKDLR